MQLVPVLFLERFNDRQAAAPTPGKFFRAEVAGLSTTVLCEPWLRREIQSLAPRFRL